MNAKPEAHRLVNATRGTIIATDTRYALKSRERSRGLLGRDSMGPGEALVFPRCRQVHMFGMRFPIDVLFLDRDNRVVRVLNDLLPGRLSGWVRRARTAVELPAGTLKATATDVDDEVRFDQG